MTTLHVPEGKDLLQLGLGNLLLHGVLVGGSTGRGSTVEVVLSFSEVVVRLEESGDETDAAHSKSSGPKRVYGGPGKDERRGGKSAMERASRTARRAERETKEKRNELVSKDGGLSNV